MWNNSRSVIGWNICFYCSSTRPIKSRKGSCFETQMKQQKPNTWIYMNKIIWVQHKDSGRKIGLVTDSKIQENIIMFISEFVSNDIKVKMEAKKQVKYKHRWLVVKEKRNILCIFKIHRIFLFVLIESN